MRSLVQNSYPTFWGHLRGTPPLNYLACVGTEDYAKSFKTPINTPKKFKKKKEKKKKKRENQREVLSNGLERVRDRSNSESWIFGNCK